LPEGRGARPLAPEARARNGAAGGMTERAHPPLPDVIVEPVVRAALAEDLGRAGDLTSQACIGEGERMAAVFRARKGGVIAGLACARLSIHALDPSALFEPQLDDGAAVQSDAVLARVEADARALLSAERTAL